MKLFFKKKNTDSFSLFFGFSISPASDIFFQSIHSRLSGYECEGVKGGKELRSSDGVYLTWHPILNGKRASEHEKMREGGVMVGQYIFRYGKKERKIVNLLALRT